MTRPPADINVVKHVNYPRANDYANLEHGHQVTKLPESEDASHIPPISGSVWVRKERRVKTRRKYLIGWTFIVVQKQ